MEALRKLVEAIEANVEYTHRDRQDISNRELVHAMVPLEYIAEELEAAKRELSGSKGEEGTCPVCGARVEFDGDCNVNGEGDEQAGWTCDRCGSTGTQVRELIFREHISVRRRGEE